MSSWPWIGLGLQMPYKCPYKWPANGMQMAIHTTPLYPLSICRVLGPDGPPPANSPLSARGSKIQGPATPPPRNSSSGEGEKNKPAPPPPPPPPPPRRPPSPSLPGPGRGGGGGG